ncbi:MAG: iron-sulfur cluster assembly scaffold protein [Deltaproteobacteria bacterium RBG_13_52_11]|nr:MAG: iron-sulfur cluster assembly scaffold protein [Deltaproteobacteria bacterium RBG_13_52_11]
MIGYSEKVIEHFKNPRNAGVIDDADGIGEIGDKNCGDLLRVFIKVAQDVVTDVKYQIRGCGAAIACASAMTELAIGKHIEDAMMLSEDDIVEALDGLPEIKLHCSNLGAAGLRKAIMDYFGKTLTKERSNEI